METDVYKGGILWGIFSRFVSPDKTNIMNLSPAKTQIGLGIRTGWTETLLCHYENMPIQMYWKFYIQKMKIFR